MVAGFCQFDMSSLVTVGGLRANLASPRQRLFKTVHGGNGTRNRLFWRMCGGTQYSEGSSMDKLRRLQDEKLQKRKRNPQKAERTERAQDQESIRESTTSSVNRHPSATTESTIGLERFGGDIIKEKSRFSATARSFSSIGEPSKIHADGHLGEPPVLKEVARRVKELRHALVNGEASTLKSGATERLRNKSKVSAPHVNRGISIRRSSGRLPRIGSDGHTGIGGKAEKTEHVVLPLLSSFMEPNERFESGGRTQGLLPRKGSRTQLQKIHVLGAREKGRIPSADTVDVLDTVNRGVKGLRAKKSMPLGLTRLDPMLRMLDEQQLQAVMTDFSRETLVLASPGSGKTRVLTFRIAHLIKNCNIHPARILAVTFTNKAAQEMKWRIGNLLRRHCDASVADAGDLMSVGTFHSLCARFLRIYGGLIGIKDSFQIVDRSGQLKAMTEVLKEYPGDPSQKEKPEWAVSQVSRSKNNEDYLEGLAPRLRRAILTLKTDYNKKLRSQNQLDFDDLLLETKRMLSTSPEALSALQSMYEHVLVDEWQDINMVQYDILRLLTRKHRNLFVVGDADQSIYHFRGAHSKVIERFTIDYPKSSQFLLENNYRSSKVIVMAAQKVIEKNRERPEKIMQTSNELGSKIVVYGTHDDRDEALYIANESAKLLRERAVSSLNHIAIMYRTNAQSRLLEETFIKLKIPYRLVGGIRFYNRHEVKDVCCYLRIIDNPLDNHSLERVLNVPPRGIGVKTVEALFVYANKNSISGLEALASICKSQGPKESPFSTTMTKNLRSFYNVYQGLCDVENTSQSPEKAVQRILEIPGFKDYVRTKIDSIKSVEKGDERWRNVEEVRSAAANYDNLRSFLEYAVLMADSTPALEERKQNQQGAVTLMTIHGAKGLEFSTVFIAGVEDGCIPMLGDGQSTLLEEERRLAYVGMTRAKNRLYMTYKGRKRAFGSEGVVYRNCRPSRFLADIPAELVTKLTSPRYSAAVD